MLFLSSILLLTATAVNSQIPGRDYRPRNYYEETPKPYSFSYNAVLDDGIGQISRTETSDASGRVQGSYSLANDEGHTRVVDYVADENGFRAHVRTNEPGTDNQNPADVVFESSSQFANRNYQQYAPAGRPAYRRRPVLNAAAVRQPVAGPEAVSPDGTPENALVYSRPVPPAAAIYSTFDRGVRNPSGSPFGRVVIPTRN